MELILPRPLDPHALHALPEAFPQIWLSVVGGRTQAGYFSHFQAPGFDAADRAWTESGFGVSGLPTRTMLRLARRFGQAAVYVYTTDADGALNRQVLLHTGHTAAVEPRRLVRSRSQ